jgi:hypothetical protein
VLAVALGVSHLDAEWRRHTIDASSRGADGVRLADINRDGLPDIATGWEEGGVIRVYLNPGAAKSRQPWPKMTAGSVPSPEDAVLADLDKDGNFDVVSATEGKDRKLYVHWGPDWRTAPLPAAAGRMQWMFTVPVNVDDRNGVDLVAGAKNEGAQLGWFESPPNPRDLAAWKWHPLYEAGWIMSIVSVDMDGDRDLDLLVSDRKGPKPGVLWLKKNQGAWREHRIGASSREVMFLTTADLDRDGLTDVLSAVKPREILFHRRLDASGLRWKESAIPIPPQAGTTKAVAVGDIDLDGKLDIVFSCEEARGDLRGVMWLSYPDGKATDISGVPGTKYDLVQLIDLDADGDLDVLTCEETDNLGVIWYENPAKDTTAHATRD